LNFSSLDCPTLTVSFILSVERCGVNTGFVLVEDLKKHTQLEGYSNESPQVKWFWEVIAGMDSDEIALFLQFVTGCSKIPLEGFKALQGMRGI